MPRHVRTFAQWSIGVALVGYVLWFVLDHREVFTERFDGTRRHAVLLACGILATWIVNSLQTLLPLRELGVRVGFWENLLLTLAATFGNYLPMRAGTMLRMQYVKSVYGVGYLRYGGILGARALLLLWAAGVVGWCGAAGLTLTQHTVRLEVFVLFTSILGIGVAPFLCPLEKVLPTHGVVGRAAAEVAEAVVLIRRNRRMTAWYLGLVFVQFGILTARLMVAFDVMNQHPTVWVYCFLSPIATILSFVSITPGNLGLREWLIGVLSAGAGIDYALGLFAAALDRVVLIAMTFSIGALAGLVVVVRLARHPANAPSS
jgi:hypothetical protein